MHAKVSQKNKQLGFQLLIRTLRKREVVKHIIWQLIIPAIVYPTLLLVLRLLWLLVLRLLDYCRLLRLLR